MISNLILPFRHTKIIQKHTKEGRPSKVRYVHLCSIERRSYQIISNLVPIEYYYSLAAKILTEFDRAVSAQRLDDAFIPGRQFLTFSMEVIPKHNYYRNRDTKDTHCVMDDMMKMVKLMNLEESNHKSKLWARARGSDGRLPLVHDAATRSLKWSHMSLVFNVYIPGINEIDMLTGLPVFMLAATGPNSDIESVYNLLREYPPAMSFIDISITGSPRKRIE